MVEFLQIEGFSVCTHLELCGVDVDCCLACLGVDAALERRDEGCPPAPPTALFMRLRVLNAGDKLSSASTFSIAGTSTVASLVVVAGVVLVALLAGLTSADHSAAVGVRRSVGVSSLWVVCVSAVSYTHLRAHET